MPLLFHLALSPHRQHDFGWPQLPPESSGEVMIFAFMHKNYHLELELSIARTRKPVRGVCREESTYSNSWDFAFRRLVLDQDRLADFDNIVSHNERRRSYVDQIVLSIKLDDYDCTSCEKEEDKSNDPEVGTLSYVARDLR